MSPPPCDLSPDEYRLFRILLRERAGIELGPNRANLLRARLGRHVRAGRFSTYRAYFDFVREDVSGAALTQLIDALTTNTTAFFREPHHFEFLATTVRAWAANRALRRAHGELRLWSAGCATGEEAYSLAMTVDDALRGTGWPFRILATDLSTAALRHARAGCYAPARAVAIPGRLMSRYLRPRGALLVLRAELRRRVTFAALNLLEPLLPFRREFHAILCRNVMMYFDGPTRQAVVNRLAEYLVPGGCLLTGHAESLAGLRQPLAGIRPAVYQRAPA